MSIPEQIVSAARSLFDRGYSYGTSGNISVRDGGRVWITPTNSSFGTLRPQEMALIGLDGAPISPDPGNPSPKPSPKASKEAHFHLAAYRARPSAAAVVHLHSTYATAVASLRDIDMEDALPVFTPYFAMRIPKLAVVDYYPPGDPALGPAVEARAAETPAILLRNHGPITIGDTLDAAVALAEELEEQSRLYFILEGRGNPLTADQIAELRRRFR
ncbi:MAG: class II aldolase/adducin family protein [Bryobacteraceae bacterium]